MPKTFEKTVAEGVAGPASLLLLGMISKLLFAMRGNDNALCKVLGGAAAVAGSKMWASERCLVAFRFLTQPSQQRN